MLITIFESLFSRLGIIVLFAFVLSKTHLFKRYILKEELTLYDKIFSSIIFGSIGIITTYWGIPIYSSIANSRIIPITLAGIFGGPVVGTAAGIIAGVHRIFLPVGRLTALSCGISTIAAGTFSGFIKKYIDEKEDKWIYGVIIGIVIEIMQMGFILLIARPFEDALRVVKIIFIPMTFINSIGIGIFLIFIHQIYDDYEKAGAVKAQLSLTIATKTLPYFRKGFNEESAQRAAKIIYDMANVAAVSFTDSEKILAHVGMGDDHHKSGRNIYTKITKKAIREKRFMIAQEKSDIECTAAKCPLKSVIVVPLKENEKVIGTLKLYRNVENGITVADIELVKGLAHLFNTQIELSKIDYHKDLLNKAEIKMLQAQIQPHFLFNALNTIVSFCRTDAKKARQLLLELSYYLRSSFKSTGEFISIDEEIKTVMAYLNIEKARFSDRLKVKTDIQEGLNCKLPPLILQPIVENAVKHGLLPKKQGGIIEISAKKQEDFYIIQVKDNGVGMSKEKIRCLLDDRCSEAGIGIKNINNRLKSIFGQQLQIESEIDKFTIVTIKIPVNKEKVINDKDNFN